MKTAPEFTEWSVAERRKFRCGAAVSGYRRRPRPFAVRSRRKSSGVDRGYADPVVVHEYVSENNALHLIPRQSVRRDPVDFFLFHITVHCCRKDFAVVAIENCRYVKLAVAALYFGNVGKQFPKRLFGFEIPFYEVLAVLNLCCGLCCAAPSPSSVQNPHFRHRSVYSTKAYADPFLFKSHVYPPDAVIVIVGVFIQNRLNFDRKKLSCRRLASVFQPSVIARFADLKHAAHRPDTVFVLVVQNKYVSLAGLYLFRVFMFNKLNRKNRVRPLICYLPPEALRFPVQARGC